MTPEKITALYWYFIAGLALLLILQLTLFIVVTRYDRGHKRREERHPVSWGEYRFRFLRQHTIPIKRRALYVSQETYIRYIEAARYVLDADKPLLLLTDAILCDHMERYRPQIEAIRTQREEADR